MAEAFFRAHPNPFNPTVTITYGVPGKHHVALSLFDTSGHLVKTLESTTRDEGIYTVSWDGTNGAGRRVSTGVYFARMTIGAKVLTSKLILLK